MIEKSILVFVSGILVGIINAIAGGGMLIGFPVLLFIGLPALSANASSNIIVLAGQFTSSIGYRKYIRKIPRGFFYLLVPSLIGGVVGSLVLRHTTATSFELIAPILIITAVLLFIYQPFIKARLYSVKPIFKTTNYPSPIVFILIFLLSIYGGYFGAGFGLVMLAILSFTRLRNIHEMNGLKNLSAMVIAVSSIIVLFNSHLINWHYGLIMSAGTAIGGFYGAKIAMKLSLRAIRIFVILIGSLTAIYMLIKY